MTMSMTLVLAILIIYVFTFLGFTFYNKQLIDDELTCDKLSSCLVYYITLGLRKGGGIGDSLSQ